MPNAAIGGFHNPQAKTGARVRTVRRTATAAIGAGDPCTLNQSGGATRVADGAIAAPFDAIAKDYIASGATGDFFVDLHDLTFEIACDDNSITSDVRGQCYDLVQAAITAAGISGCKLDASAAATSNVMRVVDMVDRPDNFLALTGNVVRVELANYRYVAVPAA